MGRVSLVNFRINDGPMQTKRYAASDDMAMFEWLNYMLEIRSSYARLFSVLESEVNIISYQDLWLSSQHHDLDE